MTGKTTTRVDLVQALHEKIGLPRDECATMLEAVLDEIGDCLADGEAVKVPNFGSFTVRQKGERTGRNPKTNEEVPIKPRRIVIFRASEKLKTRINGVDDASSN